MSEVRKIATCEDEETSQKIACHICISINNSRAYLMDGWIWQTEVSIRELRLIKCLLEINLSTN